ncbi:MAG: iron ABC transporter substrate-binding protein [Thermomicrobiales bacterium]
MSSRVMSRRGLLRAMAGGAVAMGVLPLLAACGDDDDDDDSGTTPAASTATTGSGAQATATTGESVAATPTTAASPAGDASPTTGTGGFEGETLVVYSGRSEELVQPIIDQFGEAFGVTVEARYGDSAEMAALILEEGDSSPADVFFSQDAGALGAISQEGLFAELPEEILGRVDSRFSDPEGLWVGVSARARAVVYNTDALSEADIPASILDFTDEEWSGRLGWAPTNASFQAFVTALRVERGDDVAREWLEGMVANDIAVYEGNTPIVQAAIDGEIDAGFVNHYYLLRMRAEAGEDLPAENYIYSNGDPGALVNVAGAGVLASGSQELANAFVGYLLDSEAQQYFADETFEYPLIEGVEGDPGLVPLAEIETPDIDLSDLADLEGTLEMLRDVGIL